MAEATPHALLVFDGLYDDDARGVRLDVDDAGQRQVAIALHSPRDGATEATMYLDQRAAETLTLRLLEQVRPRPTDTGAWRLPDGRIYALIGAKLGAFLRPKNATQLRDALSRALHDDHAGPPTGGPRVMNRGHHTTHQTPKEVTP